MSVLKMLAVLFVLVSCSLVARAEPDHTKVSPVRRADRVGELVARGTTFEQRGDPTTAIAFFRDAVAAGPRDARGYRALGASYLALSEWAHAREVFEAGARAVPDSEELWWGLFETERHLERTQAAMETLRTLLEINPKSVRALSAMADLTSQTAAWTNALAAVRTLITMSGPGAELERQASQLMLRARALELILGSTERVRVQACPAASAVLEALGQCP